MENILNTKIFIALPLFTTPQQASLLLLLCLFSDLITGLLASWIEFKNNTLITNTEKRYFIESKKLRLTAVKFTTYAMGILGAWGIEIIFFTKKISLDYIITKDLTLTTFVIGYCCMVEMYSIFFENIKRMGFDIIQKTKTMISEVWKLYKTIKNGSANN
ncbi:phage holin family protein [Flavobacterium hauense]